MVKSEKTKRIPSLIALRWLIYISIIVVIVPILWMWASPETFRHVGGDLLVEKYGGFERLSWWQHLLGLTITLIPAVLFSLALLCLLPLIRLAERGDWFNAVSEQYCARAGKLLLWHALASWLSQTALVLVMTATNAPGKRALMISFESGDLLGLIPALMALAIAHMMRVGRAQREELNEIV
ncbi:hypothetical protein [Kordiimonas aestuarii]|uniref:hypothetical protein n=1 Tax=Kordiimonas aestuarii TaxID=1005925 RepID=UPI0021D33171|nr:hypothetical protein [Kordiimonas aestuarii]